MATTGLKTFDEIAGVIGEAAALRLSLAFRGLRIYVLESYGDTHPMVQAIGREAANLLSDHMHGITITIPDTPGLKSEVFRLADSGQMTAGEIAAQLYISQQRVERWLSARRNGRDQFDLFASG